MKKVIICVIVCMFILAGCAVAPTGISTPKQFTTGSPTYNMENLISTIDDDNMDSDIKTSYIVDSVTGVHYIVVSVVNTRVGINANYGYGYGSVTVIPRYNADGTLYTK